MRRILIATTNAHKLREIRGLLAGQPVELLSLADLPPVEEPEETGETFADNARLKALYYDRHLRSAGPLRGSALRTVVGRDDEAVVGLRTVAGRDDEAVVGLRTVVGRDREAAPPILTVAEDSGLVIDALDGEPGVRSARFVRPDASYADRFDEIFRRLRERPGRPPTARFVCSLAAAEHGAIVFATEGLVEGEIVSAPHGRAGFGYDPIFWFPPYGSTLADVTEEDKLRVAHRGQAFRAFADWLKEA